MHIKTIVALLVGLALASVRPAEAQQPEQTTRFRLAKEHALLPYPYLLVFVPKRLTAIRLSGNLSTQTTETPLSEALHRPIWVNQNSPEWGLTSVASQPL